MAVYVDPMRNCLKSRQWPWPESCHMVADDIYELHLFASNLGLKRSWFQNNPRLPHYDLTAGVRKRAVALGAVEIGFYDMLRKR